MARGCAPIVESSLNDCDTETLEAVSQSSKQFERLGVLSRLYHIN